MLSSMVPTSCTLETRAASQLSASESWAGLNSLRAHSRFCEWRLLAQRAGAIFQLFSTPVLSSHSVSASSRRLLERGDGLRRHGSQGFILQLAEALNLLVVQGCRAEF